MNETCSWLMIIRKFKSFQNYSYMKTWIGLPKPFFSLFALLVWSGLDYLSFCLLESQQLGIYGNSWGTWLSQRYQLYLDMFKVPTFNSGDFYVQLGQILFFLCCPLPTDRKMRKNRVVFFFFFFFKCQIWAKNLLKFVFNGLKKHLYICVLTAFRPSYLETYWKTQLSHGT